MSHKNYNKMYNNPEKVNKPELNDNVYTVPEVAPITTSPDETTPVAQSVTATVIGCSKLNVRAEPNPRAEVLAVIDASNEVVVYDSESFGQYYKICTASGIEGYCIKDYLKKN